MNYLWVLLYFFALPFRLIARFTLFALWDPLCIMTHSIWRLVTLPTDTFLYITCGTTIAELWAATASVDALETVAICLQFQLSLGFLGFITGASLGSLLATSHRFFAVPSIYLALRLPTSVPHLSVILQRIRLLWRGSDHADPKNFANQENSFEKHEKTLNFEEQTIVAAPPTPKSIMGDSIGEDFFADWQESLHEESAISSDICDSLPSPVEDIANTGTQWTAALDESTLVNRGAKDHSKKL